VIGLLPLAIHEGQGSVLPSTGAEWGLIVTMGLATALVPQMLFTVACQKVGPVRTAAAGSFELPTMFLVGWLVFGEAIGAREIVSALLVLSAILVAPAIIPKTGQSGEIASLA
jgi:drug/metabolite transporter (DMT)-like permease